MNTIVAEVTQPVPLDPYIPDVLMRDLVGHDRAASAFLVYLWLWRRSRGEGRERIGASLQTIATQTGVSKSAVQGAVRHLARRRLVSASREGPTSAPIYLVLEPWRRSG
ncbi:MAG TPA: helix-turn-helix domain-containing protein [Allosphingosinicella sp.]|jgi:hypothetical protein|nr:helix-turn-helix domain-containing protein [Allosphingosinicella sp.]